ncbi:MAG: hypothetical protein HOP15_00905 [Planctomycetes bacterium]|nr:hypothetical protein [Planctomycetota bacterium]
MHRAVRCWRLDVVAELLAHGANANALGCKGAKPLNYARTPVVAQLLREYEARGTPPSEAARRLGNAAARGDEPSD